MIGITFWWEMWEESGLATTNLHELEQLERLGEKMQLRMTHLDVDKHKIAFPGIDGFIEDGEIAIPISLKEVTSPNIKQLGKNIRAIAESANKANATPDFDGILKDITAMITAKRFTKQIIDKIVSVRQQHPMDSKIVKRYFVEGKDGSAWIDF